MSETSLKWSSPRVWPSEDERTWYVGAPSDVLAIIASEAARRHRVFLFGWMEEGETWFRRVESDDPATIKWKIGWTYYPVFRSVAPFSLTGL